MNSTRSNLLVVSMILNLGLLLGLGYLLTKSDKTTATEGSQAQSHSPSNGSSTFGSSPDSDRPDPGKAIPKIWNLLEAEDYPTFIANLKKIGCPDETIRLLVAAEINEKYAQQMKELIQSEGELFKYWQTGMNLGFNASVISDTRALERSRKEEMQAALGELGTPEFADAGVAGSITLSRQLTFLPEEQRSEVMDIYTQFQLKRSEIMMNANGVMLPPDQEAIQALSQEMNEQLASMLTPEQKTTLDLYLSDTANMMRSQLVGFNPTEEEFRSIFEIQQAFDQSYPSQYGMMSMDPEEQEAMQLARQEMESSLKETLGEDRYQDYQKAQDYSYRALTQLSDRLGLEAGAADEVYGMQQVVEKAQNQILDDPNLSMAEKGAALREIANESMSSVAGLLGEDGYKYYLSSGGFWLDQLETTADNFEQPLIQPQDFDTPQSTDAQVLELVEEVLLSDEPLD